MTITRRIIGVRTVETLDHGHVALVQLGENGMPSEVLTVGEVLDHLEHGVEFFYLDESSHRFCAVVSYECTLCDRTFLRVDQDGPDALTLEQLPQFDRRRANVDSPVPDRRKRIANLFMRTG